MVNDLVYVVVEESKMCVWGKKGINKCGVVSECLYKLGSFW